MPAKLARAEHRTSAASAVSPEAATETAMPFAALSAPLEPWFEFQADLFKVSEPALTAWIERRAEGGKAFLGCVARLAASRSWGELAAAHADWLDGAVKRLALDFAAFADQARAASGCTARATQQLAETTRDLHARSSAWVVSRAEELRPVAIRPREAAASTATTPEAEAVWHSR